MESKRHQCVWQAIIKLTNLLITVQLLLLQNQCGHMNLRQNRTFFPSPACLYSKRKRNAEKEKWVRMDLRLYLARQGQPGDRHVGVQHLEFGLQWQSHTANKKKQQKINKNKSEGPRMKNKSTAAVFAVWDVLLKYQTPFIIIIDKWEWTPWNLKW